MNQTTRIMLPCLKQIIPVHSRNNIWAFLKNFGFISAYVGHNDLDIYPKLYLLFDNTVWLAGLTKLQEFFNSTNTLELVYNPSKTDGSKTMFIVSLPAQYHADMALFKKGCYSLMKEVPKNFIGKKIHGIFTKSTDLKKELEKKLGIYLPSDAQVWSIMDENDIYCEE